MEEKTRETLVTVDEIKVKQVFQLKDGRMELRWEPLDRVIPDEIEYLSRLCEINLARTDVEAANRPDPVEYIFNRDAFWEGLRCPKEVWGLFMKSKGFTEGAVLEFYKAWAKSPIKGLIDKVVYDRKVSEVAAARPWEKK